MNSSNLSFSFSKQVPLVLQTEIAECGLAAIAMVASFHGHELDISAMRRRYSANFKGMNLQQIIDLGDSLGLSGRPLKCPIREIYKLQLPCILHWGMNHFVVLARIAGKGNNTKFSINDPSIGKRILTNEEFRKHFTGICLELTPTSKFEIKREQTKMNFTQLWSSMSGLKSGLTKLTVLSLILQFFSLMTPYYLQWVVDEVLISFDKL